MPAGGDVHLATPGLGEHFPTAQQPELNADAREADALPSRLRARGDVVVARKLAALHAAPVIDDRQRGSRRIYLDANAASAGVERVRNDLGANSLLERPGRCALNT